MATKKLLFTVSVLGAVLLAGSPGAFAVPVAPFNSRPVAVAPGGGDGSEPSLQSLLATAGFSNNVVTGQSNVGMWESSVHFFPTSVPTMIFENAGLRNENRLGIWSGTDSLSLTTTDIFLGSASPGARAGLSWATPGSGDLTISAFGGALGSCGVDINCGTFSGISEFGFGFYLQNPLGGPFYTVDSLNPGGAVMSLAYQLNPGSDTWAVAFEDVLGGDGDFNDLVFRIESIKSVTPAPVPEPASLVLMGSGLAGLGLWSWKRSKKQA